jgi:hypothetical protein
MNTNAATASPMFPKPTNFFNFDTDTQIRVTRAAKLFLDEIRDPSLLEDFRNLDDKEKATVFWREENLFFTKVSGFRIAWRPSGDDRIDVIAIVADKPLD